MKVEMSGTTGTITMMKRPGMRRIVIGAAVLVAVGIGWYLFRPELLFVDKTVSEALPTAAAKRTPEGMSGTTTLASGRFHGVAHETKGIAAVHELGDGRRLLRLTGFETSNGPDVRVYLVAADDATDSDTVKNAGHVELGRLKGNIGDQNYEIPGDLDLNKYQAVTIWCRRFGVNFGTAPLEARN